MHIRYLQTTTEKVVAHVDADSKEEAKEKVLQNEQEIKTVDFLDVIEARPETVEILSDD
jgi:thioester reductase-like protein